jgi:DNA mismatch repair protein MutS2
MHPKSLETLEFGKALADLAGETAFSVARELALALEPALDPDQVARRQATTSEAVRLLDERPRTGVQGAHDIRGHLGRAARGGVLTPTDLVAVASTLRSADASARLLTDLDPTTFPQLSALGAGIPSHGDLVRRLEGIVNDDGEILDSASPRLRRLRADVRQANQRLQERVRTLVSEFRSALQEPIVTMRGGRYVLPVRADMQSRVRGLVHDQSASGATVYVEPLAAVELNNRLRQLEAQEREEVERILQEISGEIGAQAGSASEAVAGLADFDLQLAKARYARRIRAVEPVLNRDGRIDLRGARHPLLLRTGIDVVPIDFRLGDEHFMVVITGPNTGGKTVALKTVGLLTLMAQAGLHVPADPDSELAIFDDVFADIGDEQSIEQSLSTFSSHLTRIVEVLRAIEAARDATPRPTALALFDELGAGTDPDEGSALARSILTFLRDRRVPTVATTHYSELKAFAHEQPGVVNASVTFDVDTLSPTYRLEIGVPGRSNALAIAERLGLDPRIVRGARSHLGTAGVRMEGLLEELEQERASATRERQQAAAERAEVQRQREGLEEERFQLEQRRAAILDEARAEGRRELDEVLRELNRIRAEARREQRSPGQVQQLQRRAKRAGERVAPVPRPQRARAAPDAEPALPGPPRPGDTVRVMRFGQTGRLQGLSADGEEGDVQLGSLRAWVPVRELERVGGAASAGSGSGDAADEQAANVTVRTAVGREPVAPSLDLRGRRVEAALGELETYLDDAALSGMSTVRIVHGIGTGAVRSAVREHLRQHPLVKSAEPAPSQEGGDGATVVRLA